MSQGPASNSVKVNNAAGAAAVNIQDGGNTITVDGAVTVSGTATVSGSVTANAGTNLNTSLLALEAGGNLAAIAASTNVLDDWDETDRAKVNIIAGQVGVQGGSGTTNALTQRVVLATDVALPTGANTIGSIANVTTSVTPGTADANLGKLHRSAYVDGGPVGVLSFGLDPFNGRIEAPTVADINGFGFPQLVVTLQSETVQVAGSLSINSIIPGTTATELGKAEDAAHATGHVGVMPLAVRNDADTALAGTTLDYIPLGTDSLGRLRTITQAVTPGTAATNLGKAEDAAHASGDTGVMNLAVRNDGQTPLAANGDYIPMVTDEFNAIKVTNTGSLGFRNFYSTIGPFDVPACFFIDPITLALPAIVDGGLLVAGNVAHDAVDTGYPNKIGMKAIAHGTNPTAVAAADRTNLYANRAGIPFVIGGHPNIISIRANYTAAQTDTAIVTVGAGAKIVVTSVSVSNDNATIVDVGFRIGFGATTTPTTTGVVLCHPGLGGGDSKTVGDGSGILGVGADGEDLRITSEVPTTGSIDVNVSYYSIES